MVDTEDFDSLVGAARILRSEGRKTSASGGKKSAKSLFGMLRHRAPETPVSLEKMEVAAPETPVSLEKMEVAVKIRTMRKGGQMITSDTNALVRFLTEDA
ncbi:MAG: hypothetical protein DRI57_24380 [Deltaproteobacteria bacterium]|nr:MAG: hypothetical protein DRI57_24380 [Deltaproteobacteria bacterium]